MTTTRVQPEDVLRTLRLLLIEDSPADAELALEMLTETLPDICVRTVGTLGQAVDALASDAFDVALVDLSLRTPRGSRRCGRCAARRRTASPWSS